MKSKEKQKSSAKNLWKEFKKFINRGNVIDMAVGVIMGGAFSAIVTAFTNILLSVCTWGVPGGLKGLVSVLPAVNDAQKGMDAANGLGQFFDASQLQTLATNEAIQIYGKETVDATPTLIENIKTNILGKYTLHGTTYTYNMSAVIDWGTLINAAISFIIIALTLFVILKTYTAVHNKRLLAEAEFRKKNGIVTDEEKAAAEQAKKDAEAKAEADKQAAELAQKEADKLDREIKTLKALEDIKDIISKK